MGRFFSSVPEALRNAQDLAAEADSSSLLHPGPVLPSYRELSEEESGRLLQHLCRQGISRRFGKSCEEIESRLRRELAVIRGMGYSGYFLVVRDLVVQCPRTCGRGSSASSLVSFLLGITHVDPIKHNLFFERFLNAGRPRPPDIDIDFPWDERDSVLDYVFRRYPNRSAMVANHVTFGPRAAVREVAKALGSDQREVDRLTRLCELESSQAIPDYIWRSARRIVGMVRYIGTHCGGVVITPDAITNYAHVQFSSQGLPVIAWDKDSAEEAGLVKIDLLGNRSLAVLRDVLHLVEKRHGRHIEWENFEPVNDVGTRRLIEAGNTIGVFYVESPATRQLLKKMARGDYEHLIIASSIIRPAAREFIKEFVDRLHGKAPNSQAPAMSEALKDTYGIMVYQEDVSRVTMAVAGFSAAESECFRRIVMKSIHQRDRNRDLAAFRTKFMKGGERLGSDPDTLEEIWKTILSFTEYSFCKAHSAAFALVSYKLAYMKCHYPVEFMASVINNQGGFYSCQTYLNEARRMGIRILPPDVNRSQIQHAVETVGFRQGIPEGASARIDTQAEGKAIRIGLQQLRGLSQSFLERLVRLRQMGGDYHDIIDFSKRCSPSIYEMRILIRSGTLDRIAAGITRPALFWAFFRIRNSDDLFLIPPIPNFIGDYTQRRKLLDEVMTLGVMVSRHPVGLFTKRFRSLVPSYLPVVSSRELHRFRGRPVSVPGLLVTGKEVWTKRDELMIFVSFEDRFSVFETVFFPNAFRKYRRLLDEIGVFLVSGIVDEDHGAICIDVQGILRMCGSDFVPGTPSQNDGTADSIAAKHSTRNCRTAMTP